jgi:hypothetical protein
MLGNLPTVTFRRSANNQNRLPWGEAESSNPYRQLGPAASAGLAGSDKYQKNVMRCNAIAPLANQPSGDFP